MIIRAKGKNAAEILIYEDIGEGWFGGISAKTFAEQLKALGKVDTIDVRINSYGGQVFDGLAMYRQLADHSARIAVHIDGVAASIASVIAMAGDEIHIAQAGHIMIHDAWAVAMGDAKAMRDMAMLLESTTGAIADVYAARSGRPAAEFRTMMSAETWLIGEDAVEAGLATSVVENLKIAAAKFDPTKHKFNKAPAALVGRPNLEAATRRLAAQRNKLRRAQTETRGAGV